MLFSRSGTSIVKGNSLANRLLRTPPQGNSTAGYHFIAFLPENGMLEWISTFNNDDNPSTLQTSFLFFSEASRWGVP